MRIVVCLKAVPTQPEKVSILTDGSGLRIDSQALTMNESDEFALEQALSVKKQRPANIGVITIGSIRSQDVLHRALAKGADSALRVDGDEFDPNIVALKLSAALKKLSFDLILTGVESLDGMSSQVGIAVASILRLPFAYAVTHLEFSHSGALRVERELGGGRQQILAMPIPALLCIQSGAESLTYPPAVKLIQARRRQVPCWSLSDLGLSEERVAAARRLKIINIEPQQSSRSITWLTGSPEALADAILNRVRQGS